ncbi:MAG: copper chaperone PCu(A)C, partial [Alphaproteobacteria bacterium]|nr:copper chaperone PCu(A)C [Alphaproteobacteria bacterium]
AGCGENDPANEIPSKDSPPQISISEAWAWPNAIPERPAAVYFTIANTGGGDVLVAAASEIAKRGELHTHEREGDIFRMRQLDTVEVPAGKELIFAPAGHHVMLFGISEPISAGDEFPLTLTFERSGAVEVIVTVMPTGQRPGAEEAQGMDHQMDHKMDHSGH